MLRSFLILLVLGFVAQGQTAAQSWEERSPMPQARAGLSAVVHNGYIYVMGGGRVAGNLRIPSPFSTVVRYDPASDTWHEDIAPMPTARANAAAVVLDGRIFVIGGHDRNGVDIADVDVFDPASNEWIQAAGLKVPRQGHTAVVLDNQIYVLGGAMGAETLDSIEIYSAESDAWTLSEIWSLDRPRVEHASVVIDEVAYSYGGIGPVPLATLVTFSPDEGTEIIVPPLHIRERGSPAAAVVGDSVFVLGGRSGLDVVLDEVFRYVPGAMPIDGDWLLAPRMLYSRENFAAVSIEGAVFAIGGFDGDKSTLSSVESIQVGRNGVGVEPPVAVAHLSLRQNHPNPFTSTTTIEFVVPGAEPKPVSLVVYDVHGRVVARLLDAYLPPGLQRVEWDGRAAGGGPAASGLYLYVLRHGEQRLTSTMTLIR